MEHGMNRERGCAVISKATRPDQRTVTGTLRNIEMCVAEAKVDTPALVVVGDVVQLAETLNWFESRPLFGKRIVVTRAREQASELKRMLEESGAEVLQFPMIEIAPPESWESLDRAVNERYDWLVFTSTNGVHAFFERLFANGKDVRALASSKIAAVGQATADELRARGIQPDLVPERFISTELLPLLPEDQRGIRTALIRAEEGRDELIDALRKRGGEVDLAIAYRTIATDENLDELREHLGLGRVDVVTFTSASTVDNFFARLQPGKAKLASIGPATSDALRRHGRAPDLEAPNATIQALYQSIVKVLGDTIVVGR
jgi:uroporphyrinogen III methyltransferase/synthase